MREKAALEFSGIADRSTFSDEVRAAGLSFPILASVRVLVRKNSTAAEARPAEASAAERAISAILVEATEQPLDLPKHLPNASMSYLNELLQQFGSVASDRMLVAPATAMLRSPLGGRCVRGGNGRGTLAHAS